MGNLDIDIAKPVCRDYRYLS